MVNMKNLPQTDYVMYVDASGDDGFKLDAGSSLQYAVSCFLMKREDIEHNMNILLQIKHLMGAKEKDEVKYSKVHRHPNREEIHTLLKSTKGYLLLIVAFKKEMLPDTIYAKALGGFSHALSITFLSCLVNELKGLSVSIYIDRMKQAEMQSVESLLTIYETKWSDLPPHTIEFKDSKATGYELIQMADIFAGIARRYFESSVYDPDIQTLTKKCPLCYNKAPSQKLCRKDARQKHTALKACHIDSIIPLLKNTEKISDIKPLTTYPKKNKYRYWYLFCTKK